MNVAPNYQEAFVCYIDILGFKKLVKNAQDRFSIKKIYDGLYFKGSPFWGDYDSSVTKVSEFSDHITISFLHCCPERIYEILGVVLNLTDYGMMCRGAISHGHVCHNENVLFGPALIEAYDLESNVANFPRIIISDDVYKKLDAASSSFFRQDFDGIWYLDYFYQVSNAKFSNEDAINLMYQYLPKLKQAIDAIPQDQPALMAKKGWSINKFNEAISRYIRNNSENQIDINFLKGLSIA